MAAKERRLRQAWIEDLGPMEGRGWPDTGLLRRHGGQACRDVEDAGFRGMEAYNPGVALLRFRERERHRKQGGGLRILEPDGLHPLVPQE